MKSARAISRLLLPMGLLALAACQTPPKATEPDTATDTTTAETTPAAPAAAPGTSAAPTAPQGAEQEAQQGVPVAIYLADTERQEGWAPVEINSGILYVNPEPVLTREHLAGVQAGANAQGAGLLAFDLNEEGRQQVTRVTARYPNKRLALVVGRTMLAAPGYSTPVTSSQLVFGVGSEQNALMAARAIAGLPEDGSADAQASSGAPR